MREASWPWAGRVRATRVPQSMASRSYRFVQVDVFTDQVFGGNPLAVFLDGRGIEDAVMQQIAREMNLSETVFLLPPSRPDCAAALRIFTPAREVPFAGHPTVGTAWVLAVHGMAPRGAARFALEEKIGPVPVDIEGDPARPDFIWMTHGPATFDRALENRDAMARALGLSEADLLPGAPIQPGSTGNTFLFVPLRDRASVDRAALDVRALLDAMAGRPHLGVFVFSPDPDPAAGRVYSRMFAPHTSGVPEDPATGSASGPLGAYLALNGLVRKGAAVTIVSEQGTKMGRPSFIHIRLAMEGGTITGIRVGGSVVPVLEGELRLSLPGR
jgi:trans-2,3-dihydro-3-hydroxyanthranilate isomerase